MKRLALIFVLAVIAVLAPGRPAAAGGDSFTYDRAAYEPGERAFGWATAEALDQIHQDGPFFAWLVPVDDDTPWGEVPVGAEHVGRIVPHTGRYEPSMVLSSNHLTLEFTVPDLPPGEYTMVNCNDPCTTGIQGVTWGGSFRIRAAAGVPTSTTSTSTTSTSTTSTSTTSTTAPPPPSTTVVPGAAPVDDGGTGPPAGLVAGLAAGVLAAIVAGTIWLRRQPAAVPA